MSEKCITSLVESKAELTAELKRIVTRGRHIVALLNCVDALEQISDTESGTVEELEGDIDELEASL
jgi:hypothetical protein